MRRPDCFQMDDFATARSSLHARASGSSPISRASGTTSNLNEVTNDTGRVAFCGPYVLSAITGYPISKIERAINAYRELPPDLTYGASAPPQLTWG